MAEFRTRVVHKCGNVVSDVSLNQTSFLTDFIHYCPKCGDSYDWFNIESFVGYKKWVGFLEWKWTDKSGLVDIEKLAKLAKECDHRNDNA